MTAQVTSTPIADQLRAEGISPDVVELTERLEALPPDRQRDALIQIQRTLDAIDRMQAGEATEQDRERLELCLGEDWETLFVDE
jgi:hypothetical protein